MSRTTDAQLCAHPVKVTVTGLHGELVEASRGRVSVERLRRLRAFWGRQGYTVRAEPLKGDGGRGTRAKAE